MKLVSIYALRHETAQYQKSIFDQITRGLHLFFLLTVSYTVIDCKLILIKRASKCIDRKLWEKTNENENN